MDTLGKFKTNFLNRKNPFKVGFNNRSPFSYISSTGPAVPASYDGGVPLVNFTPDQYAKAFDTSDAVRAEHEMFKKAGEAAGIVAGAVVGGVAGGIKASNNPGAGFGDFVKGFGDGAKKGGKGIFSDEVKAGVDDGMSDITGRTGKNSDDDENEFYRKWFEEKAKQYSTP